MAKRKVKAIQMSAEELTNVGCDNVEQYWQERLAEKIPTLPYGIYMVDKGSIVCELETNHDTMNLPPTQEIFDDIKANPKKVFRLSGYEANNAYILSAKPKPISKINATGAFMYETIQFPLDKAVDAYNEIFPAEAVEIGRASCRERV